MTVFPSICRKAPRPSQPSPRTRPGGLDHRRRKGIPMTLNAIEQLVEKAAIERMMYDYSYHLDMNHPDALAALFVEDCEVSYAPNFGATGMAAYKKTLEGIGTFFRGTSHHNSNIVVDFV